MSSNLLQQLCSSSSVDKVIDLLQAIEKLDDARTYRVKETVDLFRDPTSPLRLLIESNKTDDALVTAVGTFFLWFLLQPEQHPEEFYPAQEICIEDNALSEFFIHVLLPNAQSNASIYSVCRSTCRIIFKNAKAQPYFVTPAAVLEVTKLLRRADDEPGKKWAATIVCNTTSANSETKNYYAKPEIFDALFDILQHSEAPETIRWAIAGIYNTQYQHVPAERMLASVDHSERNYFSRIVAALPKATMPEAVSQLFWLLLGAAKQFGATNPGIYETLRSEETVRQLYQMRKTSCASDRPLRSWQVLIEQITKNPQQSSYDGGVNGEADFATVRRFAAIEEEILGSSDEFRKKLGGVTKRQELIQFVNSTEFRDRFERVYYSLSYPTAPRIFNDLSMLVEKIEYFSISTFDDDDDVEAAEKNRFIHDICRYFLKFPIPRYCVDLARFTDFLFFTLLGNSSFFVRGNNGAVPVVLKVILQFLEKKYRDDSTTLSAKIIGMESLVSYTNLLVSFAYEEVACCLSLKRENRQKAMWQELMDADFWEPTKLILQELRNKMEKLIGESDEAHEDMDPVAETLLSSDISSLFAEIDSATDEFKQANLFCELIDGLNSARTFL